MIKYPSMFRNLCSATITPGEKKTSPQTFMRTFLAAGNLIINVLFKTVVNTSSYSSSSATSQQQLSSQERNLLQESSTFI